MQLLALQQVLMRMTNQSTQTQQKFARQTTETATESQTTRNKIRVSSVYVFLLCLIGFTAPFWHVFHGISQREGILGFTYMSSFLYALGNPVFSICIGLLFVYSIRFMNDDYKSIFKIISYMPLFIGCYMLIYVLIPKKILLDTFGIRDFGAWVYYTVMALMSITSGYLFSVFQKVIYNVEEKLKHNIRLLVRLILNQRTNVKDIEVYDYEMLKVFNEVSA